ERPLRDRAKMIRQLVSLASRARWAIVALLIGVPLAAQACDPGSFPLFGCDAAKSRKFIELCAPSPLDAKSGYLVYRFGSLDSDGAEKLLELEYPKDKASSLTKFYAATYTHRGIYTQSVRFVSGDFDYTVFTRSRGIETIDAGVDVRNGKSGKTSTVSC